MQQRKETSSLSVTEEGQYNSNEMKLMSKWQMVSHTLIVTLLLLY